MNLPFHMQTQGQKNWCWAAVSASVSEFFRGPAGPSGGSWSQCEIANEEFGESSCCQNGNTPLCNRDWYLERALMLVQHLAGSVITGPTSLLFVQQEISQGHPVGVRIAWYQDGSGHFVAITGYDDAAGSTMVSINDPWYGPSTYALAAFTTAYESGTGYWTHTYPIA